MTEDTRHGAGAQARRRWRFNGPVWPVVGPDWDEPLSMFDPAFLARECQRDHRVQEYLGQRLPPVKELTLELSLLRRKCSQLEARLRALERKPKSSPPAQPKPNKVAIPEGE